MSRGLQRRLEALERQQEPLSMDLAIRQPGDTREDAIARRQRETGRKAWNYLVVSALDAVTGERLPMSPNFPPPVGFPPFDSSASDES